MNESDEFRQQVEELKQRLGATQAQNQSHASELNGKLASIKVSLQQKQEEIARLNAENQQLRIMLDEVIALLNQREELSSGQVIHGFFDEISELIENEGSEEIPAIKLSAPPEPSIWHDEAQPAATETPPALPQAETQQQTEPQAPPQASKEQSAEAPKAEADEAAPEEEEAEEVPALKRILKRGQRGR